MKGQRKKTTHPICNVLRVIKSDKIGRWIEQRELAPGVSYEVPEGCYCIREGRVICPKRRGEKVFVEYLSVLEEEL